jgi:hypothetical protein
LPRGFLTVGRHKFTIRYFRNKAAEAITHAATEWLGSPHSPSEVPDRQTSREDQTDGDKRSKKPTDGTEGFDLIEHDIHLSRLRLQQCDNGKLRIQEGRQNEKLGGILRLSQVSATAG